MKINLILNKKLDETLITIETKEVTDTINSLITYIQNEENDNIIGFIENDVYILKKENIECIYTNGNCLYAYANEKEYKLKKRLYFYEEMLKNKGFVKISNSELINISKVSKINLSFKGTILITFMSGKQTFCSRRKIKDLKEALNIK